jgi:hypothetical protein
VRPRRWLAVSVAAALSSAGLFAAVTSSAQAATTLGQTAPPGHCDPGFGQVQDAGGSAPGYTVPSDGVITSFSAASDRASAQVKLLILQPVSGTTYNVIAKSAAGTFTAAGVKTFPTQISVRAGQVIGDWGLICGYSTANAANHLHFFSGGDPALGAPQGFPSASGAGPRIDLSANFEPSAAALGPAPGPPGESGAAVKKCKKHKHSAAAAKKKRCKKKKK